MHRILTNFTNSPYFTRADLQAIAGSQNISNTTLNTIVQRAIKSRNLIKLKRGTYVLFDFYNKNKSNLYYLFYIANTLISPSYISNETALQYHGLFSEAVLNYYTSVTTKTTRLFTNNIGIFEYKSIAESLFNGYEIQAFEMNSNRYHCAIATPHKALFDFLYFKLTPRKLKPENIFEVLDDYRIDYDILPTNELDKLVYLVETLHVNTDSKKDS